MTSVKVHVDRGRCWDEELKEEEEEEEEATLGRRAASGNHTGLMPPRKEGHSGGTASSTKVPHLRSR